MSALSLRAERALVPKAYYFGRLFEALADAWSPDNPDGFIMAAIAENGVSHDLILERLQSNSKASTMPPEVLKYNDSKGWAELRTRLCDLLQRSTMAGLDVAPENLALSAGVSAVLDNLFFLLADDGASCLVPAPYYPMFDQDLGIRNNVAAVPVRFDGTNDARTLDGHLRQQDAARRPVRAVLVTNPDNPTGAICPEGRLKAILRWCCKHRVHCVVDEIYGWSVFPGAAFRSAMVLATEVAAELPDDEAAHLWEHVHVIVGLSKDFCGSGLRVAGLYTYNAQLIEAYDGIAHMSMVSNSTQWQLIDFFSDTAFIDSFIAQNTANLAANCCIVTDALDHMQIPYEQPRAGFFVWADLKDKLGIDTFAREKEMWSAIFDKAKVFMVPGQACHSASPGSFRICFAAHPAEAIQDMMARLQHFIDQYQVKNAAQSWDTQGYMLAAGFGQRR